MLKIFANDNMTQDKLTTKKYIRFENFFCHKYLRFFLNSGPPLMSHF